MSTDIVNIDDHPHKVFVGNLPFQATDDQLKEFFAPAGTVTIVNIISRGKRSLGYGFVGLSSAEECQKAVELLHKKELDGREINIEMARPKSELPPKEASEKRAKRKSKKKSTPDSEPKQHETEDGVIVSHADGAEKKKKKKKPRKKTGDKKEGEEGEEGEKQVERKTKPKREPRPPPSGEPSTTTVFVANLPFSLTNETLSEVFAEYKPTSATVVIRKATGRSKGFGFVEFSEAHQARLLKDVADGKTFVSEERELGIKVALSDQKPEPEPTQEA